MINQAKWITAGDNVQAPRFLKKFNLKNFTKARLSITGLGYFIGKINGQDISQDKFMPVFSDYRKRDFSSLLYPCAEQEYRHKVYYLDFDVTHLLKEGENLLEVFLGNGWYNQTERTVEGKLSFGNSLVTRFALEIETSECKKEIITSNGEESWTETQVVFNNIFYGEKHDYKKDCSSLFPVSVYPDFETELVKQICPNEGVIREIIPTLLAEYDGVKVYDAGENITGWAKVVLSGKTDVKITYAGNLDKNGRLDAFSTGAYMKNDRGVEQYQTNEYITDGKKRKVNPKFCRHCFRYFEIEGDVLDVTVEVVHTKNAVDSEFNSSNEVLNWLYDAFVRTELDNMHDGMPSDCPHRERLGYTGDGQITALSSMIILSAKDFYLKWMQDIADGQNLKTGLVQHTAPFMGGGGGPGGWGGAMIFVPYAFFKRYGDLQVVNKYLDNMLLWVNYMETHTQNDLVVRAEEGGWCLGDWAFPDDKKLPDPLVNTAFLVMGLIRLQEMAKAIGNFELVGSLSEKQEKYKKAIEKEYYNPKTHRFFDGIQGADAFALEIGLGDSITVEKLAQDYDEKGYYDTGFFGAYFLTKTLFEKGYQDVGYKLLTSTKVGSFGYMMINGATTINEHLTMGKYASDCHPMFGAVCELLFTHILGLQVSGGENYLIKPYIPSQLDRASATVTVDGKYVKGGFERKDNNLIYTANIPKGFNAKLVYNGTVYSLTEGKNVINLE